jgi:hypothetical protein
MLTEARHVFEGMPVRTAVTWGTMMDGMVDRRCSGTSFGSAGHHCRTEGDRGCHSRGYNPGVVESWAAAALLRGHQIMKFVTKTTKREIVVRDGSRFHHFKHRICSCGDYW